MSNIKKKLLSKKADANVFTVFCIIFFAILLFTFLPFWETMITVNKVKSTVSTSIETVMIESVKMDAYDDYKYSVQGEPIDEQNTIVYSLANQVNGILTNTHNNVIYKKIANSLGGQAGERSADKLDKSGYQIMYEVYNIKIKDDYLSMLSKVSKNSSYILSNDEKNLYNKYIERDAKGNLKTVVIPLTYSINIKRWLPFWDIETEIPVTKELIYRIAT